MTLLEDYNAEVQRIQTELDALATDMEANAREAVETSGQCAAQAVALTVFGPQVFNMEWADSLEMHSAMSEVRAQLEGLDASGLAMVLPSRIEEDGVEHRAVMLTVEGPSGRHLRILPFTETPAGVEWHEPRESTDYKTRLLTLPQKD